MTVDQTRAGRSVAGEATELRLAAEVARAHYLRGGSKVDIAAEMGLSRFKVARLLELAREQGMVRIEIVEPVEEQVRGLAAQLIERLGLVACWVVPEPADGDRRRALGQACATLLGRLLGPGDVLGLPWSRSVHAMVDVLRTLPRVPVVQLSGAVAGAAVDSSAVDVVRRAARVAGGGRQVFFAPLVMPDEEAAAAVRRDPAVRDTLAAASEVTVAMVGVGAWSPQESTVFDGVDAATQDAVREAGAVGEAAGVFFDARGRVLDVPLAQRVVALDGAQLLAIPTVLSSCQDVARVPALAAAVQGGLVNALVLTVDVAEELLAMPVPPEGG